MENTNPHEDMMSEAMVSHGNKLDELISSSDVHSGGIMKTNEALNELNSTAELILEGMSKKEKPEPSKVNIEVDGATIEVIEGPQGEKGDKGDKGDTGPAGKDGKDGADGISTDPKAVAMDVLKMVLSEVPSVEDVVALIPKPKNGRDGKDGQTVSVDQILAMIPTPKNGIDGSPDSGKDIVAKLKKLPKGEKLSYDDLDDRPDFSGLKRQSSKTVSLIELDDVDYSALTKVNGKYVLGSNAVTSVNGLTGAVVLTTDNIAQGSTNLYSQWTAATGGINYAGGKVGIGVVPTSILHAKSTTAGSTFLIENTQSGTVGGKLDFTTDSSGRTAITVTGGVGASSLGGAYFTADGYQEAWFNITSRQNTSGQRNMRFGTLSNKLLIQQLNDAGNSITATPFTIENSTPSNTIYANSSGYVGLGTATPSEILEVNGRTKINNILYSGGYVNDANVPIQIVGSVAQFGVSRTNGTYGMLFGSYDSTTYAMRSIQSGDKISFVVNNTIQALNILPSGYVGIGTTSPGSELVVNGTVASNQVGVSVNNTSTSGYSVFRIGTAAPAAVGMALHQFNSAYSGTGAYSAGATTLSAFETGGLNLQSNTANPIRFYVGGAGTANEVAQFSANGYLGLGTNNPQVAFHIVNTRAGAGLFRAQNSSTTGYTGFELYGSGGTQIGAFGVGGSAAALFANEMYFGTSSANNFRLMTSNTTRMTITSGGDVQIPTAGTSSTSVVTTNGTQTLVNKGITKRVSTTASSSTPTPNGDTDDMYTVTALAANATFGAPTGTPTDGQELVVRVKDNGTSRTLAYNAIYRASTDVTFPTATTISKTLYLKFKYNSADSKWDLLSAINNF